MSLIRSPIPVIRNFLLESLEKFLPGCEEKAPSFLPYFSTLYFVEILYFMVMILFIYGKTAALISGFISAAFLTFHVIGLFFLKNRSRKIQVLLMDLHIAFTAGFLVNRIAGDFSLSPLDDFMIIFRGLTALLEIPLVILITGDSVIKKYS